MRKSAQGKTPSSMVRVLVGPRDALSWYQLRILLEVLKQW